MGIYKAAFLIPINTKRVLTNIGWIFDSNNNLPSGVIDFITNNLKLKLDEKYLGIESYSNDKIQAVVTTNDNGDIEHVHIKIYGNDLDMLLVEFNKHNISNMAELFIPSDDCVSTITYPNGIENQ